MSGGTEIEAGVRVSDNGFAQLFFRRMPSGIIVAEAPPCKLDDMAAVAGTIMKAVMSASGDDKEMAARIATKYHRALGNPMMASAVQKMVKGKA